MAITAGVVLVLSMAATAYCKLTMLHQYHVDEYLATPKARMLYAGARLGTVFLALSIAVLGLCTGIWFFAVPMCLFAAFALYRNAWAFYMRMTGSYRQYYAERRML